MNPACCCCYHCVSRAYSCYHCVSRACCCHPPLLGSLGSEPGEDIAHVQINYKDTKAKWRPLKKLTCKGIYGRCLSEFIDWRYSQSCCYFRPSCVNCCPSNLLSGSTPSPHPLPCVNKYTVYTYTVCNGGGGVGGSGPQTEKHHLPQSPFTGKFFR